MGAVLFEVRQDGKVYSHHEFPHFHKLLERFYSHVIVVPSKLQTTNLLHQS